MALTCRELIELLGEYHDGELDQEIRAGADAHLLSCKECAAYLQNYEMTIRLAKRSLRSPPEPADTADDLVRDILSRRGRKRKLWS